MSRIPAPKPDQESRTLVDALLEEQRSLTAVERFSMEHDLNRLPSQAKFYRSLIPAAPPGPGEQFAFEVDLDKCSGCKACVTACHALNGLDDQETWREVGLLYSEDWRAPFQAHVTTACHHCVDPGCLNGCPVLAYDKDPVTGIVRHLDDQCIGCQYCVMKCPYEVPKYSAKRGIVRKCDMCSNRLNQGEAPACVQACPSVAIRIKVVNQIDISTRFSAGEAGSSANGFLPASPSPRHTFPTTHYKSARPLPVGILAGDHARMSPAHAHLPLVFMLVLSQLAVGLSVMGMFLSPAKWLALAAVVIANVALVCGSLHLGQPLKAWRAFLGWRTSWFSREVIAFGVFVPIASLNAAASWVRFLAPFAGVLAIVTALTGLLAVGCSAMIYADTGRAFWRASQSFGKFLGSVALLGGAGAALLGLSFSQFDQRSISMLAVVVGLTTLLKLSFEHQIFQHWVDDEMPAPTPLNKTARLLEGELGMITRSRIVCGIIGGILLPVLLALNASAHRPATGLAAMVFIISLLGEGLERYLFFRAVAPEKMPGGVLA